MYYSNIDNKRRDVMMSPQDEDQIQQTQKMHRKFINKERGPIKSNGNISNKRGAISFNIGRIMPRNINHDKQFLYEQNIKLKEQVQQFRQQMTKLKTRLIATEKQKHKIVDEFSHTQFPGKNTSSRVIKRNGSVSYTSMQNHAFFKKMLRQAKDQITILKHQNTRLKKTVKYTQINQLQIQNKYLIDECARLSEIIESKVLDHNQYEQQYVNKINELKQQLQQEKDNNKALVNQSKKKHDEIAQLKADFVQVVNRQKKLKKQLADIKKSARTQRQTSFTNKVTKQNDQIQKVCENCQNLTKQLKIYKQRLTNTLKSHSDKGKSNKQQKNITKQKTIQKEKQKPKQKQNQVKKNSIVKVDTSNGKNQRVDKPITISKSQQDYQNQNFNSNQNNDNAQDQYGDEYFDRQQNQQKQKNIPKPSNIKQKQQNKQQNDEYGDQFDQDDDNNQGSQKQQVLFTKQPQKQKPKKIQKKQRSFQQILKQTITYRMISQRYTFNDLSNDIKQSQMQQFTVQQLAGMLNDQPFFLSQDQLEQVLTHIYGHSDLDLQDKVKAKQFLKRLKTYFIGDMKLMDESQEQQLLHICAQKLQKNKKKLKKKFDQNSQQSLITKDEFIKVLKQFQFKSQQIQLLFGQCSLVSKTLQQINYMELLNKLSQ